MTRSYVLRLMLGGSFVALSSHAQALGSCGDGGELGARVSVEFEGSVYYVTTPATYSPAEPWPLIVGLHGDEGDPASSVNFFWRDVTNASFIFVAPKAPNATGSWYAAQAENEAWMDRLLESLRASYNVDLDRTSMWGLSGGAVFLSRYMLARQHILAAAEMNMGGSGRRYVAPTVPGCETPARFVVSLTDNLRSGALTFFELLTENGHETVWIDAACEGHCFDRVAAGPEARDWLLAKTLCGTLPTPGCAMGPGAGGSNGMAGIGGAAPAGGGTSMSGGSGMVPAGAGGSTAGASGTTGQSGGGTIVAGQAGAAIGGSNDTGGATGAPGGGSSALPAGAAMVQGGETTTPGFPSSTDDAGCACRATGAGSVNGLGFGLLFAGTALAFRRKRARAAQV